MRDLLNFCLYLAVIAGDLGPAEKGRLFGFCYIALCSMEAIVGNSEFSECGPTQPLSGGNLILHAVSQLIMCCHIN